MRASTTWRWRYFNVYGPRMDIHGLYTEVLIRWMGGIVPGSRRLIFSLLPPIPGLRVHRGHRPGQLLAAAGRRQLMKVFNQSQRQPRPA